MQSGEAEIDTTTRKPLKKMQGAEAEIGRYVEWSGGVFSRLKSKEQRRWRRMDKQRMGLKCEKDKKSPSLPSRFVEDLCGYCHLLLGRISNSSNKPVRVFIKINSI